MNKENKTEQLLIRVTSTEKKNIQEKAAIAHMSVSSYMIKLSEDKKIIVAEKIPQLLYEISKIGTNINQIAHIGNSQKYVNKQQLDEVLNLLEDIESIMQKILSEIFNEDEHTFRRLKRKIENFRKGIKILFSKIE